jgi:hypothetical protein
VFLATDKKYGRMVIPDGLARSARGTLVNDFEVGQTEILVKPDYDFYLSMRPGMPPIAEPTWHYCQVFGIDYTEKGGIGGKWQSKTDENSITSHWKHSALSRCDG